MHERKKMKQIFSPSIMCADIGNLRSEITALDTAGVDMFHMDIMDGEFVSNFALSWYDFAVVRSMTSKPLDVHLMVKNPSLYLPYAFKNKADIIYVHYEAGFASNYLYEIRDNGAEAGLAVNPNTKLENFHSLLPLVDKLLIMRVHPGFAGRLAVPEVEHKIHQVTQIKDRNFKIVLDGAVSPEAIAKWSAQGVDEFVLGTASGMFGQKRDDRTYGEIMQNLRAGGKAHNISPEYLDQDLRAQQYGNNQGRTAKNRSPTIVNAEGIWND
jgi:ribulose-phosphate 3-epimerase